MLTPLLQDQYRVELNDKTLLEVLEGSFVVFYGSYLVVFNWQEREFGRPLGPPERELAKKEGPLALKRHLQEELESVSFP